MSKQKKQKPAPSVSHDLRKEAKKIQKYILQEKSKNNVLHDERVFFKQMKSYVSFVASLSGAELKLPDLLQDYYMTIGTLRDTKIFVKKCDTYIDAAMVKVLCDEKLEKAKKQFTAFLKKHKSSLIAKQVRDYLTLIDARYKIFEPKWIQAGLQTYLTRQENVIKQHLLS